MIDTIIDSNHLVNCALQGWSVRMASIWFVNHQLYYRQEFAWMIQSACMNCQLLHLPIFETHFTFVELCGHGKLTAQLCLLPEFWREDSLEFSNKMQNLRFDIWIVNWKERSQVHIRPGFRTHMRMFLRQLKRVLDSKREEILCIVLWLNKICCSSRSSYG